MRDRRWRIPARRATVQLNVETVRVVGADDVELSHCRRSHQPKEADPEGRNRTRTTNCCAAPATACQPASSGVHCGDIEGYKTRTAKLLGPGATNWRLLLQFDADDGRVMWGDCGTRYFFVEEQRAREADFSNVRVQLQTSAKPR